MNPQKISVYMDVSIDSKPIGRMIFELFYHLAPKTCENFRRLCTGENGSFTFEDATHPLHLINTIFHKIVPAKFVEGGDISNQKGLGGYSIYGRYFNDEYLSGLLDAEGLLAMAPHAANKNSSKFMITLNPTPDFNSKRVVFGKLSYGLETLRKIALVPIDQNGFPKLKIKILDVGQMDDKRIFLTKDPLGLEGMQRIRDANKRNRLFFDVENEEDKSDLNPTQVGKLSDQANNKDKQSNQKSHDSIREIISELKQNLGTVILPKKDTHPEIHIEKDENPANSETLKNPSLDETNSEKLALLRQKINEKRFLNAQLFANEILENSNPELIKREKLESIHSEKTKLFSNLQAKNIQDYPFLNEPASLKTDNKNDLFTILKTDTVEPKFGWDSFLISL